MPCMHDHVHELSTVASSPLPVMNSIVPQTMHYLSIQGNSEVEIEEVNKYFQKYILLASNFNPLF